MFCAAILLAACARLPPIPTQQPVQVPSPSHNERRPNFVILHQTTNNQAEDALRTLTDPARMVSAHYLIGRDGTIYQLVAENRRAWHAGVSYWGGSTDLNSSSIGIELDNNGDEAFAEPQILSLLGLLSDLKARYQIPAANFLGHGDVAPRRKIDPSGHFPWQRLAAAGFGLWCPAPVDSALALDLRLGLQALGYETIDLPAALAAFRRHYRGAESAAAATQADLDLLLCLARQKAEASEPPY